MAVYRLTVWVEVEDSHRSQSDTNRRAHRAVEVAVRWLERARFVRRVATDRKLMICYRLDQWPEDWLEPAKAEEVATDADTP